MSQLSPVSFHGDTIFCVTLHDQPFTPVKPIAENLGLAWQAQAAKLSANKERWSVTMIVTVAQDGRNRETLCIPVRKLPAFLASINPKKVRPELREKVELYQAECDDALWDYWMKGKATRKPRQQRLEQASLPRSVINEDQLLRLAEDIRTFQQNYRRSYGLFFARLYQLGAPIFVQLEQRATQGRELVPFSDMTIHGQFDRFISERLREGMSSFAEPLPDKDNPAMLLLACARAMNIR